MLFGYYGYERLTTFATVVVLEIDDYSLFENGLAAAHFQANRLYSLGAVYSG